jgi:hypothetical protein
MENRFVVEILNQNGDVKERHRLSVEDLPIEIGRAYTNAIIISDESVCPVHLKLEKGEDGEIIAKDQNSLNGLLDPSTLEDFNEITLKAETVLKIGETIVRFVRENKNVPPARKARRDLNRWDALLARPLNSTIFSTFCFVFYAALYHFTANFESRRADAIWIFFGGCLLGFAIVTSCSASFWAFVGSLSGRKGRYFFHNGLISILIGAFPILALLTSTLATSLNSSVAAWITYIVFLAIPSFIFLNKSLAVAAGMQPRFRAILSGVIITLYCIATASITEICRVHFLNNPIISATVIPQQLMLAEGSDTEKFLGSISLMAERLEESD